ncbi:flavin reductase family protein [Phenylobacterium montanum]|uniref:Flavin reductase n=1 Tax=Phenylobacterium montanum TaxID=2823693 RepID=A0A975G3A6_9CAUL|nr:flavin reductase family protein [Caulobacter sp. S6]QUD90350.1 flavin reductase [Caulobacter sp. S6]
MISALTSQGPRGMTATSVMSLSLDPPSIVAAINRSASLNAELLEGVAFGVNLLAEDQSQLARSFAGGLPADRRFSEGDWDFNAWGAPVLQGGVASMTCVVNRRFEHSTHSLLIADVREIRLTAEAQPLVCAHGAFTGLRRPDAPPSART